MQSPGTSEHETGLAIDITGDEDYGQDTDSVLAWMNDNAYKYGFVLRYPSGKESVTGLRLRMIIIAMSARKRLR